MTPPLTRNFVASMIRDLTLDLTPEGRLKKALAAGLLAAWDELDAARTSKVNVDELPRENMRQWADAVSRAEAAEALVAQLGADLEDTEAWEQEQRRRAASAEAKIAERDAEIARLRDALTDLLNATCGPVGFAEAVRHNSGKAYPWSSLDTAESKARAALNKEPTP